MFTLVNKTVYENPGVSSGTITLTNPASVGNILIVCCWYEATVSPAIVTVPNNGLNPLSVHFHAFNQGSSTDCFYNITIQDCLPIESNPITAISFSPGMGVLNFPDFVIYEFSASPGATFGINDGPPPSNNSNPNLETAWTSRTINTTGDGATSYLYIAQFCFCGTTRSGGVGGGAGVTSSISFPFATNAQLVTQTPNQSILNGPYDTGTSVVSFFISATDGTQQATVNLSPADIVVSNIGAYEEIGGSGPTAGNTIFKLVQKLPANPNVDAQTNVINGTYVTWGFVDSAKAKENPLFGLHRKRFNMLQADINGAGNAAITVYPNYILRPSTLVFNPSAQTVPGGVNLQESPPDDIIRPLNISGNRLFVGFSTNDVNSSFSLSKLILVGGIDQFATVNPNV